MIQRRISRLPLADAVIDKTIVERHYQHRAIRAIGEAFGAKQRDALLVMATGAGKTRTVIALVDQLMKAGRVKRVLFLDAPRWSTRPPGPSRPICRTPPP